MSTSSAVLLVDDDELFVQACLRGFRALGSSIRTTGSIDQALVLATEQRPDIVITDVRLAGESGLDLIEPVRQALPDCTVVIVSAYLSVALTVAAIRKGAHLALFKPVHPVEILRHIDSADFVQLPCETPTLARAEWEHMSRVLSDCNGNVSEAARRLGILRQSLQRRLRKHAPLH
jgi:two-component system response regulator RegA